MMTRDNANPKRPRGPVVLAALAAIPLALAAAWLVTRPVPPVEPPAPVASASAPSAAASSAGTPDVNPPIENPAPESSSTAAPAAVLPSGPAPADCVDLGPTAPNGPSIKPSERAGPDRLPGVDASSPAPWRTLREAGFQFAFAGATNGLAKNPSFADNWAMMKRCGLPRGAYHFLTDKSDGAAQARAYLEQVGDDSGELPPIVDVEKPSPCRGDCCEHSCSDWITRARAWIDEVTRRTGRTPTVYTVESFWNQCLCGTKKLKDHPLWLAGWPKFDFPEATHFGGWSHWTFYQHEGNVRVAGGVVDLNLFRGSAEDLTRWIRTGQPPGGG